MEPGPPGILAPALLGCNLAAAEEEDVCRLKRSRREEVSMAAKDALSWLTTVLARLSLNFCKLHRGGKRKEEGTTLSSSRRCEVQVECNQRL